MGGFVPPFLPQLAALVLISRLQMGIIWLVESAPNVLTQALIGNFPVRVFASLKTFRQLSQIGRRSQPSLVIVCLRSVATSARQISTLIDETLQNIPVVFVGNKEDMDLDATLDDFFEAKGLNPINLCHFVGERLARLRSGAALVRYKDLSLDFQNATLSTVGDYAEDLPRKEARILHLFLENPGQCFTREAMAQEVWSGLKISPRTIDSHVSRLRRRLAKSQVDIQSVYGGGYVLR
jgi:two-component system, OmpR family, response regulator